MPKPLIDYLIPEVQANPTSGIAARLVPSIEIADLNPFCLPEHIGSVNIRHFVLKLTPSHVFVEDLGWYFCNDQVFRRDDLTEFDPSFIDPAAWEIGHPISCYYSHRSTCLPSLQTFADFMYGECRAGHEVVRRRCQLRPQILDFHPYRIDRQQIEPIDVLTFALALSSKIKPDLTRTCDFVREYDYWHDRLYNSLKWMAYLCGDRDWTGNGYISIGSALFDFLGVEKIKKHDN